MRKTYSVSGFKLLTAAETSDAVVPEPASTRGVFDPYADVVPYSNRYFVSEPPGFTDPDRVALVVSAPDAEAVTTVGLSAALVVNVSTTPSLVPEEFVAARRKSYVVSGLRLCKVTVTDTDPDPDPSLTLGLLDDSDTADVPYWKTWVVTSPPGSTKPARVAVVEPIADACPVLAVAVAEALVNSDTDPSVVPEELDATSSK
jgi:hypothetical protein